MTLPLAPTMPRKIITIPKEGAQRGSAQEKRRRRAWRVAVVVIVRAARAGSTHGRDLQDGANAVSPSVGAAPSRPWPPKGPGHLESRRSPITAFSDETRSTEPATWPDLGSSLSCAAIPGASKRHRAPRKRSASVREGANGIEQWDARHGHAAHHTGINATGARRTDRRGHHQPTRADDGRDDAAPAAVAPARPRSLYETGRTMGARAATALPSGRKGRREQRRERAISTRSLIPLALPLRRAAPSPQRVLFVLPESRAKSA